MQPSKRRRAAEAFHLSNELVLDLTVGVRSYELFQSPAIQSRLMDVSFVGATRMCVFHVVLCLAKWIELYRKYKAVLPADVRDECKELAKELRDRGVRDFRNKIAGHIWDKDLNGPLPNGKVMEHLERVCRGDFPAFLRWISDAEGNRFPVTVVSIVEHSRNRIAEEHGLTNADLEDFRFQFPRTQ